MSVQKYKDIFEYSIQRQAEQGAQNDQQPQSQPLSEMPQEKKEFLEAAIKEYVQDEVERMKEINLVLQQFEKQKLNDEQVQQTEELLEELTDILCNIDYARDFNKIGGLPTLLHLLDVPYPTLRWRAAEAIATSAQNNPPAQQYILESGAMQKLVHMLNNDVDTVCVTKALLAVSALVRHNDIGLRGFLLQGGVQILVDLLKVKDEKTQRKALFLLSYVLKESQEAIQSSFDTDLLAQIKGLLHSQNFEIQENSLDIINIIVQSQQGQISKDKLQKAGLKEYIQSQTQTLTQNDENRELVEKFEKTCQLLDRSL